MNVCVDKEIERPREDTEEERKGHTYEGNDRVVARNPKKIEVKIKTKFPGSGTWGRHEAM